MLFPLSSLEISVVPRPTVYLLHKVSDKNIQCCVNVACCVVWNVVCCERCTSDIARIGSCDLANDAARNNCLHWCLRCCKWCSAQELGARLQLILREVLKAFTVACAIANDAGCYVSSYTAFKKHILLWCRMMQNVWAVGTMLRSMSTRAMVRAVFNTCFTHLRWCYTRRFATTIFSATQRCNIVSNGSNIVPTLQRCVALKIVVANRPV